jgi:hypothetical protein
MHHLHLACEEVFVHVADTFSREGIEEQMTFKMLKQENTLCVEIICSNKVTDVDQTAVGPAYQEISEEALGLVILRQITSDLKHVSISGTDYISFKILEKL